MALDGNGRRMVWSPQLDVPGTLNMASSYPGGVVLAAEPSDGSPHPSELAVTPVKEVWFRPPWVACPNCAPLINADDWDAIAARSATDVEDLFMTAAQTELLGWFLTGESWPVSEGLRPPGDGGR